MDEMATALPFTIAWHGARELPTANRDGAYATFRYD